MCTREAAAHHSPVGMSNSSTGTAMATSSAVSSSGSVVTSGQRTNNNIQSVATVSTTPVSESITLMTTTNTIKTTTTVPYTTTTSTTTVSTNEPVVARKQTPNDFAFNSLIGEGSFSTVMLATEIATKEQFAIKICEKEHIRKENKREAIMRERDIMNILNKHKCPFFVRLKCTFQDDQRLYFVMNYAENGELLPYINKVGSFDEECTRFYAAEILMALEHLHRLNIIHRDLKPENILLNHRMHIQITDFGSGYIGQDLEKEEAEQDKLELQQQKLLEEKLERRRRQRQERLQLQQRRRRPNSCDTQEEEEDEDNLNGHPNEEEDSDHQEMGEEEEEDDDEEDVVLVSPQPESPDNSSSSAASSSMTNRVMSKPYHSSSSSSALSTTTIATIARTNGRFQMPSRRKNSFVGTAQYVSPEMLTNKRACRSSDLWALGCIVYQMTAGLPPFRAPNEYLIFQKVIKLDYEFPDGFNPTIRDLIERLLKLTPSSRMGARDRLFDKETRTTFGYTTIRNHSFFKPLQGRWDGLYREEAPHILPYLPQNSNSEELRSQYNCLSPDELQPGLDDRQMTRLLSLALYEDVRVQKSILDISPHEFEQRLREQRENNEWHQFVENNLILKQGLINKRKGLFARTRMFLLTTGPHLYYVDPVNKVLKGEIPWSEHLRPEYKNFKIFFVHTPKRIFYLEDPEGHAPDWCKTIDEVCIATYCKNRNARR